MAGKWLVSVLVPKSDPISSGDMAPALPWSTDNERGVSALQILVNWLATRDAATEQSNFAQWLHGDCATRKAMHDEILGLLEINGIRDRTQHGLALKLGKLKSEVSEARMLMTAHGLGGRTDLEGCNLKLRGEVLRICSSFELLAPVVIPLLPPMSAVQHKKTTARKRKSDTPRAKDAEEPEAEEELCQAGDEELHERPTAETAEPPAKRPTKPDAGPRMEESARSSTEDNGAGFMSHVQQMHALELENKCRQNEHEESRRKIERLLMKARAKKELMALGVSAEQADRELEII